MAIVTGDRYLEQLVRFVERNTGPLLEGVLTLKLNPVGLHYVHTRLEALHELEGLLAGAPVDYLRAYVSDLGDHRALEQLRRILGLLTALKVVSVLPRPGRDPTPVSLLPFGRLKVLELRGCDLSTSAAKGLLVLRHTLEKIICYNSTDALRHVFASRIVDIKDSPVWNKLRLVSCACNGLVLMDESLQLLPAVETLDLSRNRFAKVDNLQKLMKLRYLDLGFNHLRSITLLREVSCRIVKLILRNNALTSVRGIENLKSLEGLDLSYNIISSFTDLELIASLPSLQNLWLEGNPISCSRWYRAHVFSFFSNPEKLELDEKGISTREYWERHVIIASNRKKPAGYGFYFPAKDTAENETSQSFKKKKYSRLASIQDEEQRRFISSDQESVSCDSDSLIKEEPISDNETRIAGLMNIAKNMKNEQSVAWLREFKDYMDRVPEKFETEMEIPLGHHDTQKGKSQKPSGSSSKYVAEIAENLESFTSSSTSEFDMSFKEAYIGDHHSKGTTRMDTVVEIGGTVSLNEAHSVFYSEQDKLKYHSKEQGVSPLKMKLRTDHSNAPAGDLEAEDGMGVSPLTAIDKIIGSHTSSLYPQSPPHYREDILHRRLDLEEEFLQNSADVNSVVSSDSDTSSSSGASCELSSSILELDGLIFQASIKQGFGDNHRASHNMECIACGKHDKLSTRENNVLHDNSSEKESNTVANLIQYAAKSSYAKGISNNGVNSFEHVADKEVGGFDTQKAKPKLKRRFISLSGVLDVEPVYCKLNGNSRIIRTDLREIHGEHRSACENYDKNHSYVADSNFSGTLVGTRSFGREQDKNIVEFLQLKVADFGGSETVEEVVHCDCIFQIENIPKESEVAIVRSCENNLYVLLVDATPDGKAVVMTEVLGYHNLEDTTNAVVGLGLQVLRISLKGNITYIFLTRSCEKLKNILSLLKLCDSAASNSTCYLKSWEQVQLEMLEKYVFGLLKGIFLYSMVLFWHDNLEGESWFTRSIFVTEGYVVVCNENVPQFGCSIGDSELSYPYYSLDSFCAIEDISEVVVELQGLRCLTLTCVNLISGTNCLVSNINKSQRPVKTSNVRTWKLKWYSDDALFKFVALVKAIYLGLTDLPLPVKCIT